MNSLTDLAACVLKSWPWKNWASFRVLIAVSGGADSIALLHVLVEICQSQGVSPAEKLLVGHVNHQTRGLENEKDGLFVEQTANQLDLQFVPLSLPRALTPDASRQGQGEEALLRDQRYELLRGAAEGLGARIITTAHHADDQAETVLLRILRGTSIAGLAGIPFARPLGETVSVVRPLLTASKQSLRDYLASQDIDFRHDASNDDPRFSRNKLRHRVLPLLDECQLSPAGPIAALLKLQHSANEYQLWLEESIAAYQTHVKISSTGFSVFLPGIQAASDLEVKMILRTAWEQADLPLKNMNRSKWQSLLEVVRGSPTTNSEFPGGVRPIVESKRLVCIRSRTA